MNGFRHFLIILGALMALTACGSNGGEVFSKNSNTDSGDSNPAVVAALNSTTRQGIIHASFDIVTEVRPLQVSLVLPPELTSEATPPTYPRLVRVSGRGEIQKAVASSTDLSLDDVSLVAIFSADNAAGASCLQAAERAHIIHHELDIAGPGVLTPDVDHPSATAAPWFFPRVGIYFKSLNLCEVGGPSISPPPSF